jgi:membrane carboxypeptidase/penicillin-binding protein
MCFNYRRPFFLLPSWFINEAFKQSIVKIKNKKILSGASTISMQLINVFHREKRSRKLEKSVGLHLENNRIVSKEHA